MSGLAPPTSSEAIRLFRRRLLDFFRERKRDLPWREEDDPYRILVSEVMLQQTRVDTVIPYYRRWMERFPDLESLAGADLDEVLKMWTGLGYYRRARNLHAAVRLVREQHEGSVPDDLEKLSALPGVGDYTAGAVASIAHGVPAPAVDGNARRVLARLFDDAAPTEPRLGKWASALVDPAAPGAFNQAVMELGSTICTPRAPACSSCPVQVHCASRIRGTERERPAPRRRAPPKEMRVGVAVLVEARAGRRSAVLLRRRSEDGLLAGMWEFPGEELEDGEEEREAALRAAAAEGYSGLATGERLDEVEHRFSHRLGRYRPFLFSVSAPSGSDELGLDELQTGILGARGEERSEDRPAGAGAERAVWIEADELGGFPLSVAQARIARLVVEAVARDGRS